MVLAAAGFVARGAATAHAEVLPALSESDPVARAFNYRADASKIDTREFPEYDPSQSCSSCTHLKAGEGAERGCDLIPGKSVSIKGWCQVWTPRS